MKLYKFTAFSKDSESFEMEIQAHENILFSDLHQAIQSALEYDPLQMASFFLSDEDWNKGIEIALIDMEENPETLLMDEIKISEKILEEGQKLIYLYDFFSERFFNISVDTIEATNIKEFTINIIGDIPKQIDIDMEGIDSLMSNIGADIGTKDFDDDFDDEFGAGPSFENIDDLEDF